MPAQIPTFNLPTTIYPGYGTSPLPPPSGTLAVGTLSQLRIYFTALGDSVIALETGLVFFKLPKGTAVHRQQGFTLPDLIQCPDNSGRFYITLYVHEVAKGFPNEHVVVLAHDLTPL
jgi:hypothetical protein